VFKPVFHSPDIDLVAEIEGRLISIEVKTCCHRRGTGWGVSISTRGGNQSWSRVVKYFEPERCDYLFVHVADGRRWMIPTEALEARSNLLLGGPKYSEFEVEPGRPLEPPSLESAPPPEEYRSGQTGCAVNALALPSQVRILPPPLERASGPQAERQLRLAEAPA
jgi:hypothetical protein